MAGFKKVASSQCPYEFLHCYVLMCRSTFLKEDPFVLLPSVVNYWVS